MSRPAGRKWLRGAGLGAATFLVAAGLSPATAVDSPAAMPTVPDLGDFHDELSVGYVFVPVVVRSRRGYVAELDVDDFRLLVDDQPIPIESFERAPAAPVSVTFLQDLSGSMANVGKLELSRRAIHRFLQMGRPGDLYALASFGDGRVKVDVPFTGEERELRRAMGEWRPWGTTALHDAVSRLPAVLLDAEGTKQAAILITDGADNASRLTPAEARETVRGAEVPVYVLELAAGASGRDLGGGVYRNADLLAELALETGGAYFRLSDPEELPVTSAAIAEELRHQYVLGFSTGDGGDVRQHRIAVEVTTRESRKKGYRLTFRRSYQGGAPRPGG